MVSGSISLPCSGCFSPFPHGTGSLSVSQMYLALPDGSGRFPQNFTCSAVLRILLGNKSISCTGLSPSMAEFSNSFYYKSIFHITVLQPQYCRNNIGLGYSHFARRYSGNHFCFLFLWLLRCFSSPGLPPFGYHVFNVMGFPIRKSADQWLFAPTRSLSQLKTSFIAIESQGIRHVPLSAF
jgi:hypothetical protein